MALHQIPISELVLAASVAPGFKVKRSPAGPSLPDGCLLLCMSNGEQAFFLFNQMLEMSRFDPAMQDYTDDIYETVVLAGPPDIYEAIEPGECRRFQLDWPGGGMWWSPCTFEDVQSEGCPLEVTAVEAVMSAARLGSRSVEFLLDLRLEAASGEWRIERVPAFPDFLRLSPVPSEGFWASGWRQQTT